MSVLPTSTDPRSDTPDRYPTELESDITTASGSVFRLRPIRRGDADKLSVFHSHLSLDSIYRRYFSLMPELSPERLRHLTRLDYVNRLALIIEDGAALVGVARYDRCVPATVAEVAFVIRDDYQHLGLATQLLDALARAAWDRGVTEFLAVTLPSNREMMAVFHHSGYPVTTSLAYNEINVRFSIDPINRAATVTN